MSNIKDKIAASIAEEFEVGGFEIYLNKKNGKLAKLPGNEYLLAYTEEEIAELYNEDIKAVKDDSNDYIKIEEIPSNENFKIMAEFTENKVSNKVMKNRLIYALNRSKPFRNFKYEIDYDNKIRDQWYKFRNNKYKEWVIKQLNSIDFNFDIDIDLINS